MTLLGILMSHQSVVMLTWSFVAWVHSKAILCVTREINLILRVICYEKLVTCVIGTTTKRNGTMFWHNWFIWLNIKARQYISHKPCFKWSSTILRYIQYNYKEEKCRRQMHHWYKGNVDKIIYVLWIKHNLLAFF